MQSDSGFWMIQRFGGSRRFMRGEGFKMTEFGDKRIERWIGKL